MQTFLPVPDFEQTVKMLDYRRLGKQRVEAKQLLTALMPIDSSKSKRGWSRHPAAIMWIGYTRALAVYHDTCIREWIRRGYKNTMPILMDGYGQYDVPLPWWLGTCSEFHASHRAALLRKSVYYDQFGWDENPWTPYIWPSNTVNVITRGRDVTLNDFGNARLVAMA